MLDLQSILDRLDKVRKTSKGYSACCPVHEDKSPSLSITEKDGVILAHCFGCGANGLAVVEALNLPSSVLFEKKLERIEDKHWLLNKHADYDETVLAMASESVENLSYADYKQVKISLARRAQRRVHNLPIIFNSEIRL
jgi:hypothetical protein